VHADARAPRRAAAGADRAAKGRGWSADGRRYLDAVSSWWTNLFGHAEPRIAAAIAAQASRAGTGDPGRLLASAGGPSWPRRPAARSRRAKPGAPLAKVFYADNGSAGWKWR
jgi:adenosylmethionine-8-amino-7-oxononanoate aminotransferase